MIIFLNDDEACLAWIRRHRQGYILSGRRKPKLAQLALHRAACAELKASSGKRRWHTGGTRFMACSLDRSELAAWAAEEGGPVPVECAVCRPGDPLAARPPPPTKLAREVLEYVLESALIHLEPDCPPYRLTVGDISACFGKSPGQLAGALHQLIDAGYLAVRSPQTAGTIQPQRLVLPTRAALRTVESLQAESGEALDAELARLSGGPAT